jgi:hypothetical protein
LLDTIEQLKQNYAELFVMQEEKIRDLEAKLAEQSHRADPQNSSALFGAVNPAAINTSMTPLNYIEDPNPPEDIQPVTPQHSNTVFSFFSPEDKRYSPPSNLRGPLSTPTPQQIPATNSNPVTGAPKMRYRRINMNITH